MAIDECARHVLPAGSNHPGRNYSGGQGCAIRNGSNVEKRRNSDSVKEHVRASAEFKLFIKVPSPTPRKRVGHSNKKVYNGV